MKRVFRISNAAEQSDLLSNLHSHSKPKPSIPVLFNLPRYSLFRFYGDEAAPNQHTPPPSKSLNDIMGLFIAKLSEVERQPHPQEELSRKVIQFRDELVKNVDCLEEVIRILEEKGDWFLGSCEYQGAVRTNRALSDLLKNLRSSPTLAMEVFNWKRLKAEQGYPMTPEEYTSGITIAGRIKNVDLAFELFSEAASKQLKRTSTYNALLSAYMYNGFADKCQSVFGDLKKEKKCSPSIVTYNILISVFGRLMMIDHMEATFQEVQRLYLAPNLSTYNSLIAGYVTAWMWDSMEITFHLMKAGPVKPNINTYLLMLRGYAHSGNLDQMEKTYQMVKHHVDDKEIPLIRAMICAYGRSSVKDRTKKIEELLRLIPENEYRPWLTVFLIRLYAQENQLEKMENMINEAFEHKTAVLTTSLMRCIITTYFQYNAVDKLENFLKHAECAGWRICRSVYHCKMVMYGSQKRLEEMENVLKEMDDFKLDYTKKTFWILYKAYSLCGNRNKVEKVVGLMCKRGYSIPWDAFPS